MGFNEKREGGHRAIKSRERSREAESTIRRASERVRLEARHRVQRKAAKLLIEKKKQRGTRAGAGPPMTPGARKEKGEEKGLGTKKRVERKVDEREGKGSRRGRTRSRKKKRAK